MAVSGRNDFIASALAANVDACILWPFAVRKSSGYAAHNWCRDGRKFNVDAHRYVCGLAHGEPTRGQEEAAHTCGNKLCVNPRHLYWADHLTNMADAKRHGTLKGGGRKRRRIFEADVRDICRSTESYLTLAAQYGTDVSYIGRIRKLHGAAHG